MYPTPTTTGIANGALDEVVAWLGFPTTHDYLYAINRERAAIFARATTTP